MKILRIGLFTHHQYLVVGNIIVEDCDDVCMLDPVYAEDLVGVQHVRLDIRVDIQGHSHTPPPSLSRFLATPFGQTLTAKEGRVTGGLRTNEMLLNV